jgi:cell division protein FtsW
MTSKTHPTAAPRTTIPPVPLPRAPALRIDQPENAAVPADALLALAVALLVGLGVVMVYSASALASAASAGDPELLLLRHLRHLSIGGLMFAVALCADHRRLRRWIYPLLAFSVLTLLLVNVPGVGIKVSGARRWLLGGSFQPSEAAKLALVAYLAYSLAKKRDQVKSFSVGFLPHALVAGAVVGLVLLEPDLGTALILAVTTGVMLFIAGARVSYLGFAGAAALPVVYHLVVNVAWRWERLMAFLDPMAHRKDTGYQLAESLIAIGSGGLWGLGLGGGRQKLFYVPEADTDFIFAVIGEELGLVGCVAVAALFAVIVWRGALVALRVRDDFSRLLAAGITVWLGFQAAFNMLVVTGLLPTKGLTLPFVSAGGSSLCVSLVAAGILLNISTRAPDPFPEPSRRRPGAPQATIDGVPIRAGAGAAAMGRAGAGASAGAGAGAAMAGEPA